MRDRLNPNPYVVVSGPLAVGKTTLADLLAERLGWGKILEDLSSHPYLSDYYLDMKRWGFHTVASFLIRALLLQDEITVRLASEPLCQDWYIAEHYEIYGLHTFDEKIIDERDRVLFEQLHQYLMAHSVKPTLVIRLTASPETLIHRLIVRQRASESSGVPASYVQHLCERYRVWGANLGVPSIEIDTSTCDFARDPAVQDAIISQVQATLRSLTFS